MSTSPIKTTILKTWGGRDVNITTPATRLLLQAQVLKGIVIIILTTNYHHHHCVVMFKICIQYIIYLHIHTYTTCIHYITYLLTHTYTTCIQYTGIVKNPSKGLNPDLVSAPLMAKEAGIDSEISTLIPGIYINIIV